MPRPSDEDIVHEVLQLLAPLSGPEAERLFAGQISHGDVSRWRRGAFKRLSASKRRFLQQLLDVWSEHGRPETKFGVELVSQMMGLHVSQRVKTLIRWLTHPQILPPETPLDERIRIGRAAMEVERYSLDERKQFYRWEDEARDAERALHAKPEKQNTTHR